MGTRQSQRSTRGGLELVAVADVDEAGGHPSLWNGEVDVLSPQSQDLAASHAGAERDAPHIVQRMGGAQFEEPGGLLGVPGVQCLGLRVAFGIQPRR